MVDGRHVLSPSLTPPLHAYLAKYLYGGCLTFNSKIKKMSHSQSMACHMLHVCCNRK